MKHLIRVAMTGILLSATVTQPFLAWAGEIGERQKRQQERIGEGIASGELKPKEAIKLEAEEAKIRREKRRFKRNDGKLGPKERAKLNKDLNEVSKDIYKEKHD